MKLYITRHGTTEWNVQKRLQGWRDSNLTEDGRIRAIRLGESLTDVDFDMIYSSPQNRALETAKLIRGKKDTSIITLDALRELGFGIWEGMKWEDIEEQFPEQFSIYKSDPIKYIPIDGETYSELFTRIKNFLGEIKNKDYNNILIVTHGVTIKALIAAIKGLSLDEFSKLPVYTGTALNIVEVNDGKLEIILENDTSHINLEEYDIYNW
jgi:probable phosphoglycerate mutase